jgi:hypothetical protein
MTAADSTEEYTGEWQDNEKTGTGEFRSQTDSGKKKSACFFVCFFDCDAKLKY